MQMQENLNQAIDNINNFICDTNFSARLSTPLTQFAIKKRTGNSRRVRFRYNWNGLIDGLHANSNTKILWADAISAAINRNLRN